MTTRLHQVLGTTATATTALELTLDKPVLGVKSGYLVSGSPAVSTTTDKVEALDLAVVTVTPSADGEIRLTAPTTLEYFFSTHIPEAADIMVLEVVEKASVPQP